MKSRYGIDEISIALSLLLLLMAGFAGRAEGGWFGNEDVAIKGYDPVSYFKTGRAIQGDASFSYKWHKLTWHFVNKEDLALFSENPEKYAPQYDGYCSWAMTMAQKAKTDPEVWKIVDGKLYLNCSRASFEQWRKDIPGNIRKADRNWMKLKNEN
jgi:YHS domain-containing protein